MVLSYSLYHLFTNTPPGVRFADKTRRRSPEQLRIRRTHIIVYAGGFFEIFETLSFAHFILQLPAAAQERLRHWLDAHLHTVQKRMTFPQRRPRREGATMLLSRPQEGLGACPLVPPLQVVEQAHIITQGQQA